MKTLAACCLLFASLHALAAAPGVPRVRAQADDSDPSDCSKNHFILDERESCWQPTALLHLPRAAHTATLLRDGRVLVAGGHGSAGTSGEIYDPATGAWTLTAPIPVSRQEPTATLLADGRVLLLGGNMTFTLTGSGTGITVYDPTGDIYDPVSDTWEVIAGPLVPRYAFTATLLANGKVLVAGGLDESDSPVGSCELYDPLTGKWTETGSFTREPIADAAVLSTYFWKRWAHTATLLADGRVLVTGGMANDWTMDALAVAELYDPATGRWSIAGSLATARAYHTTSLLPDGRVLAVGGDLRGCNGGCFEVTLGSTEIYDPRTNSWYPGPELLTRRSFHSATVLRDGSVLAVGGFRSVSPIPEFSVAVSGDAESSASPALPWKSVAPMRTPRFNQTATLLQDGSVLVVGGSAVENGQALRSAEIYRRLHDSTP